MRLSECTAAYLDSLATATSCTSFVPLYVLEKCIFNAELYNDLITLNRTACIQSITDYEHGITYACTYYYMRHVSGKENNSTQTNDDVACRQFYHLNANLFDVMPCYTLGENLASLFEVSTAPLDIIVFALTLLFVVVSFVFKFKLAFQ